MHFIITFGFSITVKSDANIENAGSAVKDKVKGKVKKPKKHRGKRRKIVKNAPDVPESNKNILNIGEMLAEIHVEYDLLPGYIFKFDCRCWDTATKIYTEHGDKCVRSVPCPIKENTFWVMFSVHHLVHFNEAQLRKFFNYAIPYRMFYGKGKLSERSKKDKVKGFYIGDESVDIGQHDFLEIYPLDLPESDSVAKPLPLPVPEPITITDDTDGDFSIATYLDAIPDKTHQCKFWKMLKKDRFPSESLNIQLPTISTEVSTEQGPKSKKSKKSKKAVRTKRLERKKSKGRKQKKEVIHEMNLPAETLFSAGKAVTSFINIRMDNFTAALTNNKFLSLDMGTITVYDKTPQLPTVSSILIYVQCEDILSNRQLRTRLNPISIKLEQMSNFPDATVVANNYQYLYAKTTFVDRTVVTAYYTPARAIYFEFVKCFLREDFRPEELISFILTKFLTVEIIGVRFKNAARSLISAPEESNYVASVEIKSSKAPEVSVQEVLLGVAAFDLSDFLRGSWEVRLAGSLVHPRSIYCPNLGDKNDEKFSIFGKDSPLTSDSLMSFGTSVKIKARLACDLRTVYENVLLRDDILNRIFMILNNLNLACDILDEVSSHNSHLSVTRGSSNENFEAEEEEHSRDILTGFVIYCSDKYYIFFEGLANGYLLNVWEKVAKLPVEDGRVYYNSSCVFLRGLYATVTRFSGFVEIKLSEPLEVHLSNCSLYIGKTSTTIPAKIMRTMGLMKLATTMKSLCQNCLFPDPRDINVLIDEFVKLIYNMLEKMLT